MLARVYTLTMEAPKIYEYTRLSQTDSIRLIQLQPSTDTTAVVRCRLIETTLKEAEDEIVDHYTALSYVWGDAADRVKIFVEGRKLYVTRSLDCALRNLRDPRRTVNIWADGVCINQTDDTEKALQVQQMAKVYATAHHTVIFLGDSDPDINALFKKSDWLREYGALSFSQKNGLEAIRCMAQLPWFGRVWIFQELVVSRDPRIQYGSFRCTWDFFQRAAGSDVPNTPGLTVSKMQEARSYYQTSQFVSQYPGTNIEYAPSKPQNNSRGSSVTSLTPLERFLNILISRRGFGVADARDIIFAHVGLVANIQVEVDYSRTTAEIYERFVQSHIESTNSLSIFRYIESMDMPRIIPNLASWAPDWTVKISKPPVLISEYAERYYIDFVDQQEANLSDYIRWVCDSKIFCSTAYLVSTIKEISDILDSTIDYSTYPKVTSQRSDYEPESQADEWYANAYEWWRKSLGGNDSLLPVLRTKKYPSNRKHILSNLKGSSKTSSKSETSPFSKEVKVSSYGTIYNAELLNLKRKPLPYAFDHLLLKGETYNAGALDEQYRALLGSSHHQYSPKTENRRFGIPDDRRLARLANGELSFVPASARPGDRIYCFAGHFVPFVLRKNALDDRQLRRKVLDEVAKVRPSTSHFNYDGGLTNVELVGECFVDGLMNGDPRHNRLYPTCTSWRSSYGNAPVILAVH